MACDMEFIIEKEGGREARDKLQRRGRSLPVSLTSLIRRLSGSSLCAGRAGRARVESNTNKGSKLWSRLKRSQRVKQLIFHMLILSIYVSDPPKHGSKLDGGRTCRRCKLRQSSEPPAVVRPKTKWGLSEFNMKILGVSVINKL